MALRAIVFDFDGIIANSEPFHFRAFRDVAATAGVTLTERDYYSRYLGYDDVLAFEAMASDHHMKWTSDSVAKLVERKAARLAELEQEASLLFPGAEAFIRLARSVVPLGIASGALRTEILRVLDHAGLTDAFVAIVAAEDSPASKPAPEPYLQAVARIADATGIALAPRDCVAIEDSRWGLVSARAAGLRTVGVAHTYPAAELGDADLVVPGLDALTIDALRALCDA